MIKVSNLTQRIPPLFTDLSSLLLGDIDCSHVLLTKYSTDASLYQIMPQAIIYPKNATDIKHVLSFAREYTMPITTRGKGASGNGGSLGEGIILDMTRYFSHIRNINMMEHTITVDAGVTCAQLLEKLHAWNYDIPFLSSNESDTTVGGLIATKSASSSSFHHGTIREWVESLTVILDTGEEHHIGDGITPSGRLLGIYQEVFPLLAKEGPTLRAAKPTSHDDATGYNLWNTSIGPRQLIDQLVGSEGTLGIITSVTFRISPFKKHYTTTCIPISDKKQIATYIDIAKRHKSERLFLYDQMFMQLAEKTHPLLVPFFVDMPYVLLVTHTSDDKEKLHHTVRTFKRALPCEEYLLKTLDTPDILTRITSTEFISLITSSYTNNTLVPCTIGDGIIVTIPQSNQFLTELERLMDSLGNLYIITGNIGSGHFSVTALFDPQSKKYTDDVLEYSKKLFSVVKKYNGGISAVGGEGIARAPYVSYVYNDQAILVFKKIKLIWDPLSILNPGKKIETTTSYLQQHFKRPAR